LRTTLFFAEPCAARSKIVRRFPHQRVHIRS
jgi:hypothetical protein